MEGNTTHKGTDLAHHVPHNVNRLHAAEIAAAGFNTRLAVWLTEHIGTIWTAYGGIAT